VENGEDKEQAGVVVRDRNSKERERGWAQTDIDTS
jgi:hypothetical protein